MKKLLLERGDVVTARVNFSGIERGRRGVCLGRNVAESGVTKLVVLMDNERVITFTGREAHIFFDRAGKLMTLKENNADLAKELSELIC